MLNRPKSRGCCTSPRRLTVPSYVRALPLAFAGLFLVIGSPSKTARASQASAVELEDSFLYEGSSTGVTAPIAVGDVNGDSVDDYLFVAPQADPSGLTDAGIAYLLFGPIDGQGQDVLLESSADVIFAGIEAGGQLGAGLGATGGRDLNGDGLDDLVLAAPYAAADFGKVYILFGRASGWGTVTLSSADVIFTGTTASHLGGGGVVMPGDLDSDGYEDLLIGASAYSAGPLTSGAGQVYVFYGSSNWAGRTLASANALIRGETRGDAFGATVARAGDLNGDGKPDFAVSASGRDTSATDAGAVYLFGGGRRMLGTISPGSAAMAQLQGDGAGDYLGAVISGGDVDSDDYSDLLIASPDNDNAASNAGQVYLLRGRASGWPGASTKIGASAAVSFVGASVDDRLGAGVGPLEDLNGDGSIDLIAGASGSDVSGTDSGELAFFLGPHSRWSLQTSITRADLRLGGEDSADSLAFTSGLSSGATNQADVFLLAAAPGHDRAADDAGAAYLVHLTRLLDGDGDGFTPALGDCDDLSGGVFPGADEVCNAQDDDCDGGVDEDLEQPFYLDSDGDGYGAGAPVSACTAPPGYSVVVGDCDDGSSDSWPGAPEQCDGHDNDCDGEVPSHEADSDGDGFLVCQAGDRAADCDDSDASTHPGAVEQCDGHDNDCNGEVEASEQDQDGDGVPTCAAPGDCDDDDPQRYPGAQEVCDDVDQDCDPATGGADDHDQDSYPACADCDDQNAATNPGAGADPHDGIDNDCDGETDEDAEPGDDDDTTDDHGDDDTTDDHGDDDTTDEHGDDDAMEDDHHEDDDATEDDHHEDDDATEDDHHEDDDATEDDHHEDDDATGDDHHEDDDEHADDGHHHEHSEEGEPPFMGCSCAHTGAAGASPPAGALLLAALPLGLLIRRRRRSP